MNKSRTLLEFVCLLAFVLVAAVINLACSGSSHSSNLVYALQAHSGTNNFGVLENYHDFGLDTSARSAKDLEYIKNLVENHLTIGVMAPTAPGAAQMGVFTGTHDIGVFYFVEGEFKGFTIPLLPDEEKSTEIQAIYPAVSGSQWLALSPAPGDWLTLFPTQTQPASNAFGQLRYMINFGVENACSGCRIDLTTCSGINPFLKTALGSLLEQGGKFSPSGLFCRTPIQTYVNYSNVNHDTSEWEYLPSPLIAAFGFYGGPVHGKTSTSTIIMNTPLQHTSSQPQLFTLSPINSEQGWHYEWQNSAGEVITQVMAIARPKKLSDAPHTVIKIVGSNLPVCSSLEDTIWLTATMVATPTLQAKSYSHVSLVPALDTCTVADVGISQISSHEVISGSQWVTFTLAVSNYGDAARSVIFTNTLPAAGWNEVRYPPNCQQTQNVLSCALDDLGVNSSLNTLVAIHISPYFAGTLTASAQAQPVGAVDSKQYDNAAWSTVVVNKSAELPRLYLPLVRRGP